jgi:hypothetical protein
MFDYTDEVKSALQVVRDKLASGEIPEESFDMWEDCGSVCCIGGWVAKELGINAHTKQQYFVWKTQELRDLFFPPTHTRESTQYYKITVAQAVQAIDNFKENKKPRWDEILRSNEAPCLVCQY